MARILVIGASRGIGLETVRAGLAAGHEVRALARHVDPPPLTDDRLDWIAGDATDGADLAPALIGMDAVFQTLGVALRPWTLHRKVTLFSAATEALIPAMRGAGVTRLIAVTGFGAGACKAKISRLEYPGFWAILGRAYDDKDRQEAMIEASGLDWTIVRPGVLTNGAGGGRYRVLVEPETWRNGIIARRDVAHFLMSEFDTGRHVGKAPVIVY